MFRMKSSKFDNIVVCFPESIAAEAELWNTITLEMTYNEKTILVLLVEDDDLAEVLEVITPDYVGVDDRASFMYTLAYSIIHKCAGDALRNIINGDNVNLNEFQEAFRADTEFDTDIWNHASHEVKRKLLLSLPE